MTDNENNENTETPNEVNMTDNDTTNEDPQLTLEECFAMLADAEADIQAARDGYSEALSLMARLHGKSFTAPDGTLHQIRTRKGAPYLATLKESPKVYLARAREEATARKAQELLDRLEASGGSLVVSAPVSPVDAVVTEEPTPVEEEVVPDPVDEDLVDGDEIVLQ